ncbi:MAG: glycosyltransferase family 9 protein [Holophagales bacterium]|nr:glycosyltransferase family 9 protein [Holophagales bacterium]
MSRSSTAPPRVLLVRTSAMGDIVHALPVLSAIRRAWPEAPVAWVVETTWAPILEAHPDIERLVRVRTKAWRKRRHWLSMPAELRRAVGEMRSFGAEIAFDLMGNFKGAALARLSGASRVVGASAATRSEGASALLATETVEATGEHAVDRALSLLAAFGGPEPGTEPGPVDFGADRLLTRTPAEAMPLLERLDASDRPLVLIQPGAGWGNKVYPPRLWAEVARELRDDGCEVLLPLAPGDEALCAEIAERSEGRAAPVDAVAFGTLAALHRRASLVLGGDTGPIHLAHALGASVLCLVGPTDPVRNGPHGARDRVLFHELPCSRCYKRFEGPRACLLAITPAEIVARARPLIHGG